MAFPQQRISLSRESWGVKIGNPKTQENLHPHPAFLQNRILARPKSARSIKRFRILHGRLLTSCGKTWGKLKPDTNGGEFNEYRWGVQASVVWSVRWTRQ